MIAFTWLIGLAMLDRASVVYLRAQGVQSRPMTVYGVALVLKLLMAALLIPAHGAEGLIALNLGLSVTMSLAMLWTASRTLGTQTLTTAARAAARPALATLLMAGALLPMRHLPAYLTAPAGCAVYTAALIALGGVDRFDRQMLFGRFRKEPVDHA